MFLIYNARFVLLNHIYGGPNTFDFSGIQFLLTWLYYMSKLTALGTPHMLCARLFYHLLFFYCMKLSLFANIETCSNMWIISGKWELISMHMHVNIVKWVVSGRISYYFFSPVCHVLFFSDVSDPFLNITCWRDVIWTYTTYNILPLPL